jgi:hypothetical protein
MLRSLKEIFGYRLDATDGEIGSVKDLYFDDRAWRVRYVVADTGGWLRGRRVLISPAAIGEPDWTARAVPVSLTKEQIESSPPIESDKPVSRQHEKRLVIHYGWPAYWAPVGIPAVGMTPAEVAPQPEKPEPKQPEAAAEQGDPRLRSVDEVAGYHIRATDGEIGHVEDFIAETDGWVIRYMAVNTRNLLPGKKVLLSPSWIDRISWSRGEVAIRLGCAAVKDSPEYDPSAPVNREYEARLYDYYGLPRYWEKDAQRAREESA